MERNEPPRRKPAYIVLPLWFAAALLIAGTCMIQGCAPAPEPLPLESPMPEAAVASEDIGAPETAAQLPAPLPADDPVPSLEVIEQEPDKPQLEVWPVWMRIPVLSVDAEIQATEPDSRHMMEIVPSASILSWLRTSPIPGNDGNALMGGHNKWGGKTGQLIALDTLAIGDEMEIEYEDGTCLTFLLESVFVYALETCPADMILDLGGEARVTLITCKDPFNPQTGTSDNRIVAIFKEESVFVIPDPPVTPFPPRQP